MSGINIRNIDRTGNIPEPDSRGRIVLLERPIIAFGLAATIFGIGCLGLASVGVLIESESLQLNNQTITITWFTLCFSVLAFIILAIWLLFPIRLIIDQEGISLRKMAITSSLAWKDILEIKLLTMATNSNYSTVATETFTEVKGRSKTLSWDCEFPSNPKILADYLRACAHNYAGQQVELTSDPSTAIVGLVTNVARFRQASAKIMLGFLIIFGALFCIGLAIFRFLFPQLQI